MRKTILALSVAAAAVVATSASAQTPNFPNSYAPIAGAVAGTVVGLGFSEHWWGSAPALGTVGGAVSVGLLAGIGTAVLINSVTTPCQGFLIGLDAFNPGPSACGQAAAPRRVAARRVR